MSFLYRRERIFRQLVRLISSFFSGNWGSFLLMVVIFGLIVLSEPKNKTVAFFAVMAVVAMRYVYLYLKEYLSQRNEIALLLSQEADKERLFDSFFQKERRGWNIFSIIAPMQNGDLLLEYTRYLFLNERKESGTYKRMVDLGWKPPCARLV